MLIHHRKKLAAYHHKHKHNHPVAAAVFFILLGFYTLDHSKKQLPEEAQQVIEEVATEAGEAVAEAKSDLVESEEFQSTKEAVTDLAEDTVSKAVGLLYQTNEECVAHIRRYEGVRLETYRGPSGKLLIGYGHSKQVHEGMKISLLDAEKLLREDLKEIEADLSSRLVRSVTHNQFSAMVCLAYNIGTGSFAESTVLKETNAGDWQKAADGFLLWNKVRVGGVLKVSEHLDKKRQEERSLYLKG